MSESTPFTFRAFERSVRVDCADASLVSLLDANFGAMSAPYSDERPALRYRLARSGGSLVLRRDRSRTWRTRQTSDLLFFLEKDVTIELQKLRRDLYFVHAAALERDGHVALLVAASGVGKSTTSFALLHHGFRYLSDELAPIDASLRVHHYPHALCLKAEPPEPYRLPESTLRTSRTLHVPAQELPRPLGRAPRPLRAIFFIERDGAGPGLRPLSAAEGAARLYAQALNALAHPAEGLDTAVVIAGGARCFELRAGALSQLGTTCQLVRSALAETPRRAPAPRGSARRSQSSRAQRAKKRSGRISR
jgi:hypothetical protein